MEEMIDFDEWFESIQNKKVKYYLVYNAESGKVVSVCPEGPCPPNELKIEISSDMAESIFNGSINPDSLEVDHISQTVKIIEVETSVKVDYVMHRVPEKNNSTVNDVDIYIRYERNKKQLTFELTEKFGGTYRAETNDTIRKEPFWNDDLTVDYMIGDLNDPNIFNETITVRISDMIGNKLIYDNIDLPEQFSIYYSKRILRNHVFEEV